MTLEVSHLEERAVGDAEVYLCTDLESVRTTGLDGSCQTP